MRIHYVLVVVAGCGGGSSLLAPGTMAADPAIVTRGCAGLPMDGYGLGEAMTLEGSILKVSVSYGGGCEEHTFAACWDGAISKSNPATLSLTLAHDAHDDLCDAFITRDLFIDLADLPPDFGSPERGEANSIRLTQQ